MNSMTKELVMQRHGMAAHDEQDADKPACEWRGHGLPFEKFAKMLMNGEQFLAYVHKHGYHFTPELADHVTKMMTNDDGSTHHWTTAEVQAAMATRGWKDNVLHFTWGDAAYLANMAYADFYPDVLESEGDCLRYAYKMANDADGYEGMAFARWQSDVVAKEVVIDWEMFV